MSNQYCLYVQLTLNPGLSTVAAMSSTASKEARPRRMTQQERSAVTRHALLDATIESLIELGYERSTTTEISERALLSRGAHQHHFETRAKLFAAAAERLANLTWEELERNLEQVADDAGRRREVLDVVWRTFTGPLYQVAVELAVHARTDPELRADLAPLEQMMRKQAVPLIRRKLAGGADELSATPLTVMVLATIRGLAMLPMLQPGSDIERAWEDCRGRLLELMG
jgi:AcrR family transcriptional regulator